MHPLEIHQLDDGRLRIRWQDQSESTIDPRTLREQCPCTACAALRHSRSTTYIPLRSAPSAEIRAIDLVGSSAIHVVWGDGHDRSIYPYPLLRSIAPPAREAPGA